MMSDIFSRLNKNEEPIVKAVAILFSDGTIDSMDQIINCALSTTHDCNDEIIISGKYHAFITKDGL